jgi:hypothetical protein
MEDGNIDNIEEASEIARSFVAQLRPQGDPTCKVVVNEQATIENEYGWIFFYDSEQAIKYGDVKSALVGNFPILVERGGGQIRPLPVPWKQSLQLFIKIRNEAGPNRT